MVEYLGIHRDIIYSLADIFCDVWCNISHMKMCELYHFYFQYTVRWLLHGVGQRTHIGRSVSVRTSSAMAMTVFSLIQMSHRREPHLYGAHFFSIFHLISYGLPAIQCISTVFLISCSFNKRNSISLSWLRHGSDMVLALVWLAQAWFPDMVWLASA